MHLQQHHPILLTESIDRPDNNTNYSYGWQLFIEGPTKQIETLYNGIFNWGGTSTPLEFENFEETKYERYDFGWLSPYCIAILTTM